MNTSTISFLEAALGKDGATAMRRAATKDPRLLNYLIPRTLLGWTLGKTEFEGALPGAELYVSFKKSANGYSGSIGVGQHPVTPFVAKDEFELVAELVTGLGFDVQKFVGTDQQLVRLGKSVDALLKAREALQTLAKGGVDLPGTSAKPRAPKGPEEALAPTKQPKTSAKPKLPRLPVLKVELKELSKSCKTCGGALFKAQKFTGCLCWRDLAKHATTTVYSDGAVVEFGRGADKSTVQALYKELYRGTSSI
jgi:hypothetical protein